MKSILVACGTAIATSTVVAHKLEEMLRARGIEAFRADVVGVAPMLADAIGAVASWGDVKLLTVALDRPTRPHRPGLLALGDPPPPPSPSPRVGAAPPPPTARPRGP